MRAERLLNIMLLLQNREIITAEELAMELHVSPRTIIRDMDALSSAGIPVYSIRGKYGGWTILESFKNSASHLKPEELHSLLSSPSEQLLSDLGIEKGTIDVREKLLFSLSKSDTLQTKNIWDRIYIDTGTWREFNESTPYLETVQKAVLENKKLKITYKKLDNNESERYVEPLGLVAKSNKWYLVVRSKEQFRNYRVSRILSAKILNEVFKRPPNFNLIKYWENSKTDFISRLPKYEVEVKIKRDIINRMTFTTKFIQIADIKQNPEEEWALAKLTFNDKQEAIEYILGFGNQIRVVTPQGLKEDILGSAHAVISLYKN